MSDLIASAWATGIIRTTGEERAYRAGFSAGAAAEARDRALAAPPPEAELRRDPGVDWDAIERLVDAAIRREEITAARGAEILGLRLVTWRARAREIRAAAKENDHE